ncbi:unnamed protein product [Amaranthus hypochondriacus]
MVLTSTVDNLLELSAFEEPSSTHQGIFHSLSPLLPEDDLLDFSQIATEEPSSSNPQVWKVLKKQRAVHEQWKSG